MVGNRGSSSSPPRHLTGSSRPRSRGCLPPGYSSRHATSSSGANERDASAYLNVAERWWRAYQPWLELRGYLLRPRYRQDWIPSWEQKGFFSELRAPEDAIELPVSLESRNSGATSCSRFNTQATSRKIDATRISDGLPVYLHLVSEKKHPKEVDTMLYLTSGRLDAEDGGNHTIPVLEVLEADNNRDLCIVVTPLMRGFDDPWFENMGEVVEFLGQVLEVSYLLSL
jgi:hypothetical protein